MTGEIEAVRHPYIDDPEALALVLWAVIGRHCIHCGEFGCAGAPMGCGFEVLAEVDDGGGPRVVRTRCLLRSWLDRKATGCNELGSELGTANEYREATHGVDVG